ncbi:hypothetical protein A0130_09860 [Leifsonia xyli]|uniref:hypothetical protein n=1 Tax=Leifsonia xyli TaxID=1575 RepID=UPI0007CDD3BD|nr:hypothetical protein A0130_09860 [Leifsonia xyli]
MDIGGWDGWTSVIIAGIGLGLAIWALPRQIPKARIQWVLWRASSLVALPEGSLIEVVVDGRPVRNAWLLTIRVSNTGRQSLATADWEAPIQLIFEGASEPVSAHVSAVNPRALSPAVMLDGSTVSVQPTLLNTGDMFELQVVGQGPMTVPTVTSRIRGVPDIKRRRIPYNPGTGPEGEIVRADWAVQGMFVVLWAGMTVLILANASKWLLQALLMLAGAWLFLVAVALFLVGARRRRALWRPTYLMRR